MVWTQLIETDDIGSVDDIRSTVEGIDTDGEIHSLSIEITADAPISFTGPSATAESTDDSQTSTAEADTNTNAKYSVGTSSADTSTTETTTATTAHSSAGESDLSTSSAPVETTESTAETTSEDLESKAEPVDIRKWPRIDQKLGGDTSEPLAAAVYPDDVVQFTGSQDDEVEYDTPYIARVNGVREYGAFVTLNGDGYSPKSKYHEVTGLIHETNMLDGHGPWSFEQGDVVIVERVRQEKDKLGFRQLPLLDDGTETIAGLSVEALTRGDAKQARHIEVIRLSKLGIAEGEQIRFSNWPNTREHTGTVLEIDHGTENPPRPPTLTVSVGDTTQTIRPSEVIAPSTLSDEETQPLEQSQAPDTGESRIGSSRVADIAAIDNQLGARDGAATSDQAKHAESDTDRDVRASVNSETDTEESERSTKEETSEGSDRENAAESDDSDGEDKCVCVCGKSYDSQSALWGHQSSCEAYKEADEAETGDANESDDEDTASDGPELATTGTGSVLNPVVLETKYKYFRPAAALYTADEEWFTTTELRDRMADTEWAMNSSKIQSHLTQLMDKDAVTRRDTSPYEYSLTDRGAAGVELALDEASDEIPVFD